MLVTMPRKPQPESSFGARLAALRKEHGITQVQLAEAINSTQRAISYYENEAGYPPAPVVAELARALNVTTDELLGVEVKRTRNAKQAEDPEIRRLWKKFQLILSLPEKDQRAVIRLVNSLVAAKGSKRASM